MYNGMYGDYMSKIKYADPPAEIEDVMDHSVWVKDDFLPPPEYFVEKLKKQKISLNIKKSTLHAFKNYAKKHGIHYQTLISEVLDNYTSELAAR